MSDRLTVAALASAVEAELIRGKLTAAGIEAELLEPAAGDAPQRGLGGRVQVQVAAADFERAMQLLFPVPSAASGARRPPAPAWKCPQCGEEVLGDFPVCWSCGAGREGTTVLPPPRAGLDAAGPPPRLVLPTGEAPPGAPTLAGVLPGCSGNHRRLPPPPGDGVPLVLPAPMPHAAPGSSDFKIVVPPLDAGAIQPTSGEARRRAKADPMVANDRAARRAWWTALLGVILWPLLLYSVAVVLGLGLLNRPLSRRGNWFFYGALAINALFVAAVFTWLAMQR